MRYEIEKKVRQFLVKLVGQSSQQNKDEIIEEIVIDDVQFFWSMISVDIDHHVGEQLLTHCSTVGNHTWVLNSWCLR